MQAPPFTGHEAAIAEVLRLPTVKWRKDEQLLDFFAVADLEDDEANYERVRWLLQETLAGADLATLLLIVEAALDASRDDEHPGSITAELFLQGIAAAALGLCVECANLRRARLPRYCSPACRRKAHRRRQKMMTP
jgi:hypothetical protein